MNEQKKNEIVIVEGKLTKIIHQEGEGQCPSKGQEVYALYKGTLQDGSVFDSNEDRDSPFTFSLGQGSVIKGWDEGFATMKRGQKATLVCSPEYAYGARGSPPKIPPNATLNFDVELLDFKEKQKDKWDMSNQQKVAEATKSKGTGNDHLKNGKTKQAIAAYKAGIEFVDSEDYQEAKDIYKVLNLNLAQAYLKNKEYRNCIQSAGKVLSQEPQNAKALYRRGVAYARSQQFDKAKGDFQQLLKVDPNNTQAKKQLLSVANQVKRFKEKEKKAFSAMFSPGLYDDKKIEPPKPKKAEDDDDSEPEGQPIPSESDSEKEQKGKQEQNGEKELKDEQEQKGENEQKVNKEEKSVEEPANSTEDVKPEQNKA